MAQKERSVRTVRCMADAAVAAYCKAEGIPEGLLGELGSAAEHYEVKRLAQAMAKALTKELMEKVGPQLICFWSRQGCPQLPPLKK